MAINKARFWVGILYPENMRKDWESDIGDIVQVPYAYCIHDKDLTEQGEQRKAHVHLILVFANTTTYNHALSVFQELNADGKSSVNEIKAVINIRSMYDYLIHNTETSRKKEKHLYSELERITGNNFDIGALEQLGITEKNDMCKELCNLIMEHGFCNFGDFYMYVINNYEDTNYFEILKNYSGFFERLTKSNYQKWLFQNQKGTASEE